jgi:hypothetical protein
MAYSATGFSTIAASKKGNSISLYAYSTADAIGDVNTSGYFNALANTLAVGDIIFTRTSTDGTIAMSIVYVASNASGVVDVTDGMTITATDTD